MTLCPSEQARLAKRLPYEVVARKCDKCGMEMKSAYGAERGSTIIKADELDTSSRREKVYCEKCYLGEVY